MLATEVLVPLTVVLAMMQANVVRVNTQANLFVAKRGWEGVETSLSVELMANAQPSRSQYSLIPDDCICCCPVGSTVRSSLSCVLKSVNVTIMF